MIEWVRLTKQNTPPINESVLVRMVLVGPVYDVAIFVGVQPDGERRWILADIRLAEHLITHWARINEPEGIDDD